MSLRTFVANPEYESDSSLPFKKEWARFAKSQAWRDNSDVRRKAMVDAIREEIISHYLPDGLDPNQLDGEIPLTKAQELKIYQGMCRKAGKPIHDRAYECTVELKQAPYVNIFDFIDAVHTDRPLRTLENWQWDDFVDYTEDGRIIDLKYAKQNKFLVPLLQDMSRKRDDTPPSRSPYQSPQDTGLDLTVQPIKQDSPGSRLITSPLLASNSTQFSTDRSHTKLPQSSPDSVSSSSPPVCRPSSPVSPPHTPSTSPAASPSRADVKLSPTTPSPNVDINFSPGLPSPENDILLFIDQFADDKELSTQLNDDNATEECIQRELMAQVELISDDDFPDDEVVSTQISEIAPIDSHQKDTMPARRSAAQDFSATALGKKTRGITVVNSVKRPRC